jgi:hypothetical protein
MTPSTDSACWPLPLLESHLTFIGPDLMTFEGRPMSHRSTIRIAVRGPIEANGAIGAALRAGDPVRIPVPTSPETRPIGTIGTNGTEPEDDISAGPQVMLSTPY